MLGVALLVGVPEEARAQAIEGEVTPPAPTEPAVPADERALLEADTVVTDRAANVVIAEGAVEAYHEGRTLRADRVTYDLNTGRVRASGSVQIIDADGSVRYADDIEVDEDLADGVAAGFSTRLANCATAAASLAVRQ